jgi:alpha-aminoadipic semialdehyde synthase
MTSTRIWQKQLCSRIYSRRRYYYSWLNGGLASTIGDGGRQWRSLSTTTSSATNTTTIAILRETYALWERRAPLSPSHVQELLHDNNNNNRQQMEGESVRVLVQPCKRRIFGNHLYQQAGAVIQDDIEQADIILGVKRPMDPSTLLPNKTYLFFSHTIKGQPENMDLLATCLNNKIQLLDYERMMKNSTSTENSNNKPQSKPQRLVTFGRFAGMAGAIDSFHAMGRRLLYKHGMSTPFLSCAPAILNDSLELAKDRVLLMGEALFCDGIEMPNNNEPLVIAVTGGPRGCVHQGVMEILSLLPHEIVKVQDLPRLCHDDASNSNGSSSNGSTNRQHKVHIVPVSSADIYEKKRNHHSNHQHHHDAGSLFDRADFEQNPSNYICTFSDKVAPYMQTLINCVYWDPRFPRLLTKQQLQRLYQEIPDYEKR